MSRHEKLIDEQHHAEIKSISSSRSTDENTMMNITGDDDKNELLSTNYLTTVHEEQPISNEHEDDKDEDEVKEKKSNRECATDDDRSLSERHDSDDHDDDDHHGSKTLTPSSKYETIQSNTSQRLTTTESNQKQTEQSRQQKKQMDMNSDSINESMIMSQDSLKPPSSDSFESELELKILQSNSPTLNSNQIDDFIIEQHTSEPTPSRMIMTYDEDNSNDNKPINRQYLLISNEIEIGQLPVIHARRTSSENSLFSTSSSSSSSPVHMYNSHSLSASCLIDKDDIKASKEYVDYQQHIPYDDSQLSREVYRDTTKSDDENDNSDLASSSATVEIGFFDRVKAFVTKPAEIVQEAMENRRKQQLTSSLNSNTDLNDKQLVDNEQRLFSSSLQLHCHSTQHLHDEEKSKLVRSPELCNMRNLNSRDQQVLFTKLQIQNRAQSESTIGVDDLKNRSLETTSSKTSEEFLPVISKDNSLEFVQQQQQRHSTPFDDMGEKESSSEHSESYNIPTSAFSDAFEPTSSRQRPLALSLSGQQKSIVDETMTEEEFEILTADYVNQILNSVIAQMIDEHDDSSMSNNNDKLSNNDTTSSDEDEEQLVEEDEDQQKQNHISTDMSSDDVNGRYSADESSNAREQSAFEATSARSSTTATPIKSFYSEHIYTKEFHMEPTPIVSLQSSIPSQPSTVYHGSLSDTGTYYSVISPSSGDYVDARSTVSTVDNGKLVYQSQTQSNSSQYSTANDQTPYLLTSDDDDNANESGTMNYSHNDSSSGKKVSNQNKSEDLTPENDILWEENYSDEDEENDSENYNRVRRRKHFNEHRLSLLNDITTTADALESTSIKNVSFKLDLNENFLRSPSLSTSDRTAQPRQENLDSPSNVSNEKSITKILQDEILRRNLDSLKNALGLNHQDENEIDRITTTSKTFQPTKTTILSSGYDAGSESDRDSTLTDSLKSTLQEELSNIYHNKESFIDKIKLKFERSLDRLVEKTLAGEENTSKSDIISPFTDQSLDCSLPTDAQVSTVVHAHSEQHLQACPDELDYGTLQRFSSDSCIIIHVPEQYAPSSTLCFDRLKTNQEEKRSSSNEQTSAFSFYTKQEYRQPSSSPIEMLDPTNQFIENCSPINRYTPRSLDDSSIEFGERDMTDMSDEFVLVKNISPSANIKEIKNDTTSNTSSSSPDKHESPDFIDIIQHQCDYPPLDTGFDLRSGTTLETVYESPELRQDEIKSAISTLSLTTSENNRPYSTEQNSSNTPNTDDSLMEFERIEMELLKNSSTTNIIDIVREIRSSVDSLAQLCDNTKVDSFIEEHFSSIENVVQDVLHEILDIISDSTHSISSQSEATTVITKSEHHSFDDDYIQITHDDIKNQGKHLSSSDEDFLQNQTAVFSHEKRRLSAPINDCTTSRRLKTSSSSSSSSSSFSSTSRSVIYSQQYSAPSYPQHRLLQAETDLASFKQNQQTQSATDLPFLPPFVNTNSMKRNKQSSSVSSTPSLSHTESIHDNSKNQTHSHPGSLGGFHIPPRSSLIKEENTSPVTSISPHSSSSSHHSNDCFCSNPTNDQS